MQKEGCAFTIVHRLSLWLENYSTICDRYIYNYKLYCISKAEKNCNFPKTQLFGAVLLNTTLYNGLMITQSTASYIWSSLPNHITMSCHPHTHKPKHTLFHSHNLFHRWSWDRETACTLPHTIQATVITKTLHIVYTQGSSMKSRPLTIPFLWSCRQVSSTQSLE